MDIKQQFMGKRFWLFAALITLFMFILSGLWFYRSCLNKAESSLLKTCQYMKTQCAAYTHYNAGAETQALLRAVESNREVDFIGKRPGLFADPAKPAGRISDLHRRNDHGDG